MTEPLDLSIPSVLFLKVETSGLYRNDLSMDDPGQPWAMQIAAALANDAGVITNHFSHILKAEGRTAKNGAVEVHGISARATTQIGVLENRVLGILGDMLKTTAQMRVVTFSDFDPRIISSLFARYAVFLTKPSSHFDRLWMTRPLTEFIVLQRPWCQLACKLEGEEGASEYRWPSLDEAAMMILGMPPRDGFHDAWGGIERTMALYKHFTGLGMFERAAPP